jgi:hypothetical protein
VEDQIRPVPVLTIPQGAQAQAGPWQEIRRWPRRRWAVAGSAWVVLVVLLSPVTSGARDVPTWSWWVSVFLAVPGALILASYVPLPGTGRRVDLGCTPCAVVAAGSILMALMFRTGAPADPGFTMMSAALMSMGLFQRLSDPARCVRSPAEPDRRVADPERVADED